MLKILKVVDLYKKNVCRFLKNSFEKTLKDDDNFSTSFQQIFTVTFNMVFNRFST